LVIDIAVPRNFEPAVSEIEEVYLYSIDDLSMVVEQNQKVRQEDMAKGMQIVEESVNEFMDWLRTKDVGPLIGQMRQEFAQISQKELERFFGGPRQEASCKAVAESMVNRIVNRLLHCVIKNVDTVSRRQGAEEAANMISDIIKQAEEISAEQDNNKEM
jgi:glutamyl-tRNA reductase